MSETAKELIIGLMSGTSADGIDAALVEFQSADTLRVIATQFTPFSKEVQQKINHVAHQKQELKQQDYEQLDKQLVDLYAAASLNIIEASGIAKETISAIANHGQTIAHMPNAKPAYSLQIGDGQRLADITNMNTICQFRQADLALGGQGAPLMPAFHQALNRQTDSKQDRTVFILNLGGIANITVLGDKVIGFDSGPANTLLNQWIEHCKGLTFDKDGRWASSGVVNPNILDVLLNDPYFSASYPKSTGPDYFNLGWLESKIKNMSTYRPQDIQATLLQLSVETIARAIEQVNADIYTSQATLYVCGGGAHNQALMTLLAKRLEGIDILLSDKLGVPADWVEAVGFAWLGYCFLHNIDSNLPNVTGAEKKTVLGQLFKPQ